jgi:hypothetical protein
MRTSACAIGADRGDFRPSTRMAAYFIRRLLLIPPTLIGMTLAVFALIQFTPGGRLEMALMEARMKEGGRATNLQSSGLTPGQILKLEEQFGHDKPFPIAYLSWLGAVPRETNRSRGEFAAEAAETDVKIPGTAEVVSVKRLPNNDAEIVPKDGVDTSGWRARIVSPGEQLRRWKKRNPGQELDTPQPYLAVLYQPKFSGLLQGNLGDSTRYSEPVWEMMKRRFPISIFFGDRLPRPHLSRLHPPWRSQGHPAPHRPRQRHLHPHLHRLCDPRLRPRRLPRRRLRCAPRDGSPSRDSSARISPTSPSGARRRTSPTTPSSLSSVTWSAALPASRCW